MLDYFELRHKAYERLNYIQNFPSPIPYIEFDKFDQYSLVLVRKEEGKPIGYIRIILDNPQGIMSERFYDFRDIRRDTKDTKMAELSRIVVDKNRTNNKKTSLALFEKVPEACKCLGIESLIGAMQTSQRWRYDEFGDTETLIEGFMYGNIPGDSSLINWMI